MIKYACMIYGDSREIKLDAKNLQWMNRIHQNLEDEKAKTGSEEHSEYSLTESASC